MRILKCNQLFDGGFDYPIIKLKKNQNINYNKIKIVYWYVPLKNGKYLVVKIGSGKRIMNNLNQNNGMQKRMIIMTIVVFVFL